MPGLFLLFTSATSPTPEMPTVSTSRAISARASSSSSSTTETVTKKSTSPKMPSPNPAGPGTLSAAGPLPRFLTFQFGGDTTKRVWVDTPQMYEAAVDRALQEFPLELHGVAREEVGLFANTENQLQSRIGASDAVWRFVAGRLGESGPVYVRIVRKSPPPPVYREAHVSDQAAPLPKDNKEATRKNVGTLKNRFSTLFDRRGA